MTDRKQEAEEAAKKEFGYPLDHGVMIHFIRGYLAACEKCEGERDGFLEWAIPHVNLLDGYGQLITPKELLRQYEQFKTQQP